MAEQALYDRIGGEAAIMAAVDRFYAKVLEDELTRPFFEGLDMPAQIRKQVAFMAWAFGGAEEFRGRGLREAHKGLIDRGLADVHFDRIASHLESTLRELGVADALIGEVLGTVESVRADVLNR